MDYCRLEIRKRLRNWWRILLRWWSSWVCCTGMGSSQVMSWSKQNASRGASIQQPWQWSVSMRWTSAMTVTIYYLHWMSHGQQFDSLSSDISQTSHSQELIMCLVSLQIQISWMQCLKKILNTGKSWEELWQTWIVLWMKVECECGCLIRH